MAGSTVSLEDIGSISPLPAEYRRGQTAMAVIGLLSLVTTSALWFHITCRLCRWKMKDTKLTHSAAQARDNPTGVDLSLGLAENHYRQAKGSHPLSPEAAEASAAEASRDQNECATLRPRPKGANPLLILIYNLIFADITLAAAYTANVVWLRGDALVVGSPTCKAQGWMVGFGCLTTSGFLATIAMYTYLAIVRGYQPSSRIIIGNIVLLWIFAIIVASLGPLITQSEDYFARQTLWCWISDTHAPWRLSIYSWSFFAMAGTCVLYFLVFRALYREKRSSRFMPHSDSMSIVQSQGDDVEPASPNSNFHNSTPKISTTALRPSGHHPAFLVYPFVYLASAMPLTVGSITPLGRSVGFMAFTGSMLALSGFLDAVLWSSIIAFSSSDDIVNTGLDQFAFMRTPEGRSFGNMVWVQGGAYTEKQPKGRGWWKLGGLGVDRSSSQLSLRYDEICAAESGIQMNVVTTVVVEDDGRAQASTPKDTPLAVPDILTRPKFHRKVYTKLKIPYNVIRMFFRRSVEKAFKLDKTPADCH
ncbi:uncharacterized protein BCR38DRAFT_521558 [Pseudomassariella vexata]|uniref:Uncharacterized protein n=1 Tax=Pseudomassariella vexata TaxID=1141098 RepID=A0A1Y2EAS4_9PEZI|nr:uncharacterized protein BCR38DRAFT_521558 [Pseudomassariella vexata]ORY68507.1 hypothetical protein BCR38DRAFT_521558 [Pseudomassariella vexata]